MLCTVRSITVFWDSGARVADEKPQLERSKGEHTQARPLPRAARTLEHHQPQLLVQPKQRAGVAEDGVAVEALQDLCSMGGALA